MSLNATVKASISAAQTRALDLAAASSPLIKTLAYVFAHGTGIQQADLMWADRRTLAASASESLDLSGSLSDIYGQAVVFARVKAVLVSADGANTNDVQVSRPASNGVPLLLAAGDGLPVRPGGCFLWVAPDAAGVVVTTGTGDLLTFTNSAGGTAVTYDVVLIGASA